MLQEGYETVTAWFNIQRINQNPLEPIPPIPYNFLSCGTFSYSAYFNINQICVAQSSKSPLWLTDLHISGYLLCHRDVSCLAWSLQGGRTTGLLRPCCSAMTPRNSQCGRLTANEAAQSKGTQHSLLPAPCPCHVLWPCRKASEPFP